MANPSSSLDIIASCLLDICATHLLDEKHSYSLIHLQAILRVCLDLRVIFPFLYCNKVSLLETA